MARATTRSQKQPNGSQRVQQQASQSRPAPRVEDDDGDDDPTDDAMDEDNDVGGNTEDISRQANNLVRLALFSEHRRVSLKRDEISKKVLGPRSRAFAEVFAQAQDKLRKTFGMELVELQARTEEELESTQKPKDGVKLKKRGAPSGSKQYMLRSILAPQIIELCSVPHRDLVELEQKEAANAGQEPSDDEGSTEIFTGSVFAWDRSDQLASLGVLHVVLALILVNGRAINENELRALLKRLRLNLNTDIPLNDQATHPTLTLDAYLSLAIRQGYLDRSRVGEGKQTGGKKRGRTQASTQMPNGEDGGHIWEWRWGPRSFSEIGEVGVAKLVAELMVPRSSHNAEAEDPDAGVQKRLQAIVKGVERAASGGPLYDNRQ